MAKIITKSDKFTPFGGLFFIINDFKRFVMPHVDSYLGLRCRLVVQRQRKQTGTQLDCFEEGGDDVYVYQALYADYG